MCCDNFWNSVGDVLQGKKSVSSALSDVGNAVVDVVKTVGDTVGDIIRNPLPTIETVALTMAGVPPPIASAAVTALNGGNVEDIAKSAITSYAGGQISSGVSGAVASALPADTSSALVKIASSSVGADAAATAISLAKGNDLSTALSDGAKAAGSSLASSAGAVVGGNVASTIDNPALAKVAGALTSAGTTAALTDKDASKAIANSLVNSGLNYAVNNVVAPNLAPVQPVAALATDQVAALTPPQITGLTGNNTITDSALPVNPNVGTTTQEPIDSGLSLDSTTAPSGSGLSLPKNSSLGDPNSPINLGTVTGPRLSDMGGGTGLLPTGDVALPSLTSMGGGSGLSVPTSTALGDPNSFINEPTLLASSTPGTVTATGVTSPDATVPLGDPNSFINTGALPSATVNVPKLSTVATPATTAAPAAATTAPAAATTGTLPTITDPAAIPGKLLKLGQMGTSTMGYNENLKQLSVPELKELALPTDEKLSDVDLNKALATLRMYAPDAERDITPQFFADGGGVHHFAEGGLEDILAFNNKANAATQQDLNAAFKSLGNIDSGLAQPKGQMFALKQVGAPSQSQPLRQMSVIPQLAALLQSRGMRLAEGGQPDHAHPHYDGTPVFRTGGLEGFGGKYVEGKGDGTSDDITAMLANGEYVFSADVVAALGNGSNKAGAEKLDDMVQSIRARARSAPPDKLPPDAKSPLEYLKSSKGKKHG